MKLEAEAVQNALALPVEDRAFLARELIASLEDSEADDDEALWQETLDRRGREIKDGAVLCRPIAETIAKLRAELNASRQPS